MMPPASSKTIVSRERFAARSRETSAHRRSSSHESSPSTPLRQIVAALHTLHLYGAAGIAAFGCALGRVLDFDATRYAPLWFVGAVLVYNFDRLKHDPADALNTPRRLARHSRLRKTSVALALCSAAILILLPLFARDWRLLALAIGAGVISLSYSFPLFGFRCKDVPLVKTFFAPTIVTLAYFVPPFCDHELKMNEAPAMAWTWLFLMFNMMLCDLRDHDGDRRFGTRSLPVALGPRRTRIVLWIFVAALMAPAFAGFWPVLVLAAGAYLAALLIALRRPRSEIFYEWFAEGMLFVPFVVWLVRGRF